MTKVHLDTDIGGDLDDLCALAMLLAWPGLELTGVTTVAENDGRRAGYARYALDMAGKRDVPVAAGAGNELGFFRYKLGLPEEQRYWPEPVKPAPGAIEEALELLKCSIKQGAMVIGIGPYTNLSLLEEKYPGILNETRLVLMGGYVYPPREGFPQWGNEMDFNVQVDVRSAKRVIENSTPLLVPLAVTVETALRWVHLGDLRRAGGLAQLIAYQAEAFAADEKIGELYGETCAGLPRDIINFQHDPLACAIGLGWDGGLEMEELRLKLEVREEWLYERVDSQGSPARVVTRVDGERFNEFWLRMMVDQAGTRI